MTRVMISASSPIVRAGLAALLRADPSLEIAGDPDDHTRLAGQIIAAAPDVVVIVIDPHGSHEDEESQFAAYFAGDARSLRRADEGSQTFPPAWLILADDLEDARAANDIPAGVHSFLPRDASAREIRAAVHAAAAGLIARRPESVEDLRGSVSKPPFTGEGRYAATPQALTAREIEVLRMLAEGLGNKEIAWKLKISEHTVKFHVSSIFTKLDVSSRTEAVTVGIRLGLIMV